MLPDINGAEFLVLIVVAIIVIGPNRLPEYTRTIMRMVRNLRGMYNNAREGLERESGVNLDDLRKYDPRQYDPRKIIADAWNSSDEEEDMDTAAEDLPADRDDFSAIEAAQDPQPASTDDHIGGPAYAGAPFDTEAT